MRKQTILVLLSLSCHVVASGLQICAQLGSVPFVVRLYNIVVPVLRDEVLQILAVSWSWIWDVLVRQPPLKLRLMPLVVDCVTYCQLQSDVFNSIAVCVVDRMKT